MSQREFTADDIARIGAENDHLRRLFFHGGGISPEILEVRRAGAAELRAALSMARDAEYELTGKCHLPYGCVITDQGVPRSEPPYSAYELVLLDPCYFSEGRKIHTTRVRYDGIPNHSMRPINDAARSVYAAWERSTVGDVRPVIFRWEENEESPFPTPINMPKIRTDRLRFLPDFLRDAITEARLIKSTRKIYRHERSVAEQEPLPLLVRLLMKFM